jgi:hypothetical protein
LVKGFHSSFTDSIKEAFIIFMVIKQEQVALIGLHLLHLALVATVTVARC